ncbi:hypothetical protein WK91_34550 [Burkholderia cepacia]|nr:hypothetical protein WK91_34550 [Burkholderia cepacia]
MKTAKQHGVFHTMTYDKHDFSVHVAGQNASQKWRLQNVYAECRAAYGKTRDKILVDYVLGMKEAIQANELRRAPFDKIRNLLRPLVRSRILTDNERYEFKGVDQSEFRPTPRQSFSSDANILLGLNANRTVVVVTQADLDSWNISFEEAHDIAMKNLAAMSPVRFEKSWAGFFQGFWHDYYDSSRLLLPQLFAECQQFDDPVIMIPTSGNLYVADKANKGAQLHMLDLVQEHVNGTLKIVSTQMYHFVDGKPVEYKPEDDQLQFKLAQIYKPLFQSYARQQRKIVEEYLIENGNWAYIMSPKVVQSTKGNSVATVCCWMTDMETIFPEADIIAVTHVNQTDDGRTLARTDPVLMWNEVIERYEHLIQKLEGFPDLYRAAPFLAHQTSEDQAA